MQRIRRFVSDPSRRGSLCMETYQIVLLTIAVLVVVKLLIVLAAGRGSFARVGTATSAFFKIMGDAALAEKVAPILHPPPEPAKPPKLSGEPLRLLALLQREGRLL